MTRVTYLGTSYRNGTLTLLIDGMTERVIDGRFAIDVADSRRVLKWNARRQIGVHVANVEDILLFQTKEKN